MSATSTALSMNIVLSSAIRGSQFLQASTKGISKYATNVQKINLLRATKFGILNKNVKTLDNHLTKLATKASFISKNPIKMSINRTELMRARKDLTAMERLAKRTSFFMGKMKVPAQKPTSITSGGMMGAVASAGTLIMPIKASINFESTMADITKVVDFSGDKEIKSFSRELLKLSHRIPLTVTQLGEITASGGQLGITKNKLLGFTSVVAKMSTAFDISSGQAGESMAKLMNVYGGGIQGITKLGDAINHISNNSASKAGDIVNVLGRIGGNAKTLNMTAIQASNLASSFLALGKPPEIAGTAINSMLGAFGNIEGQSSKFKNALSLMGINATTFQKTIRDKPQLAINSFLTSLNKMDKASQTKISYDMFGKEFGDDILLVSGGVEHYHKAIKLTSKSTNYLGSMQEEFRIRSSTTGNAITLLGNKVNHLGVTIGNTLLPTINTTSSFIGTLTLGLNSMATTFPRITTGIVTLGSGLLVGTVALTAFGFASNMIGGSLATGISMVSKMVGFIRSLSIVTTFATAKQWLLNIALNANPIGLVIAGVSALIGLGVVLYKNFEPVRKLFDGIASVIKKMVSGIISFGKSVGGKVMSFLGFGSDDKDDKSQGIQKPKLLKDLKINTLPANNLNFKPVFTQPAPINIPIIKSSLEVPNTQNLQSFNEITQNSKIMDNSSLNSVSTREIIVNQNLSGITINLTTTDGIFNEDTFLEQLERGMEKLAREKIDTGMYDGIAS